MVFRFLGVAVFWFPAVSAAPVYLSAPPVDVVQVRDRLAAADGEARLGRTPEQLQFDITEAAANGYLVQALRSTPRPGLEHVQVKFLQGNTLQGEARLNFDAVEAWRPGTIPAIMRPVLSGTKPVAVELRFVVADAKARFSVERAWFNGIRIPAALVEKVIEVVAARQPEKYDTTKPVPLPFGLKQVWIVPGRLGGKNF